MKINQPAHVWQLSFDGDWPTSVAFLEDGRKIAAGNRQGQIYVWNLPETPPADDAGGEGKEKKSETPPDFAPIRRLDGHTNGITALIATADGKTLISASLDRTVRLWNVDAKPTGTEEVVLDTKRREIKARRKSKEEKEKIIGAAGVQVELAGSSHGLEGHGDWVKALGLSGDGRRLISGDDACVTIVWDLASRKEICRWHGFERVWVSSAALSPDGKIAFTAEFAGSRSSFDRPAAQARLWNADDGSLKLDLLKVWTPKVKDKDRIDSYGYSDLVTVSYRLPFCFEISWWTCPLFKYKCSCRPP